MYFKKNRYFKSKGVSKIGESIQSRLSRSTLWRGIEASQIYEVYKKLCENVAELEGSQMVSWKESIIKIKVTSSVQKQEIILKKAKMLARMRKHGINAKEIKVIV